MIHHVFANKLNIGDWLSARGIHRVLKVARSIADLAAEERVAAAHVAEALSFRAIDWGAAA